MTGYFFILKKIFKKLLIFLDLNLNHTQTNIIFSEKYFLKKYLNFLFQGDHEPGKEPGDIVIQLEEKVNQSINNSSINQTNKQLINQSINK